MLTTIDFKIKGPLTALAKAAFEVVKTMQKAGFETYIAGGAVRDFYLGREVHDIDIATSAKPEEIKKIFKESYDRGKAFGVVAVQDGDFEFEVATFRTDIGIADHRRPEKIEFTTAQKDALRRDFTINGLFYDPVAEVIIDFIGGIKDIKAKIIRFINEPKERIEEDYLRMLRAVRFGFRLDFNLDKAAEEAIRKNAAKILEISAERIREELTAIITGPHRQKALIELESLGLTRAILPELEKLKGVRQPPEFHSEGDVWTHTLMAMSLLSEPRAELAWTVLLHDIAKPETQGFREHPKSKITFFEHDVCSAEAAERILERLKFGNVFIDACCWAISQHMRIIHAFRGMSERKQKRLFTHPNIDLLLDLTYADLAASLRPNGKADLRMYKEAVKKKERFEKEVADEEKQQIKKFDLITGNDIMKILKISSGPEVGEIKSKIEEKFLEGKISTRADALKMLEGYKQ